jgi:hypothetical protein
MKQSLIVATLLVALLSFTLGCYEMSNSEKNLCYSLTSRSYDYIPTCTTEESCFNKVDELFKTNLGYAQESNLYELKNHFGRSWFFYNKAIKELKSVSKLCKQGDSSALPNAINQVRNYLDLSFTEMDLAIEKSFSIIAAEENLLSAEKIDLLKEEDLFVSLIELRQILTELDNGATNSNTYVSYYLNKVESFNNSNASKVAPNLIESKPFWMKSFEYIEGTMLEQLNLGKSQEFPFITNGLTKTLNYFEAKFYAEQSLSALQMLPASEFMHLYSDLSGNNNSALSRFADLINKTSKRFEELERKRSVLWKETEEKFESCKKLFEQTQNNQTIDFIESVLATGTISSKSNILEALDENTQEFLELKKSQNATIGEEISKIKVLRNNFLELEARLLFQTQERTGKLKDLCKKKASEIKEHGISIENTHLENIYDEMRFFAAKTIQSENEFEYCKTMLEKEIDFESGLANFEELQAKRIDLTKTCFNSLDKIFTNYELRELENLFQQLKKETVTEENLFYFSDACEKIKQQALNEINEDPTILEIKHIVADLFLVKQDLIELLIYTNAKEGRNELTLLEEKLTSWKNYFTEETLFIENILPVKTELLFMLQTQLNNAQQTLYAGQTEYIKNTLTINILNNSIIQTNTDFNSIAQVIINNPFKTIYAPIKIETGVVGKLINKDPGIEIIHSETGAILALNTINSGKTLAEFLLIDKILSHEENKIVYATNKESLFQRKIILQTKNTINKLLIETAQTNNTMKVVVLVNGKEIEHYIENNKIYFIIDNCSEHTQIIVFLYVDSIIRLNLNEVLRIRTGEYSETIKYELTAKNNFNEPLEASLFLPFVYDAELMSIVISDSIGTTKKKTIVEQQIILKNQAFLEKEEKKYFVQIKINDIVSYYSKTLSTILEKLLLYNEKVTSEKIRKFLEYDFDSSKTNEAEQLITEGLEKISVLEVNIENERMLNLLREEIEKKLVELDERQKEMKKLGLDEEWNRIEEQKEQVLKLLETPSFDSYSRAMAILEELVFDVDSKILEEVKRIWEEIQSENQNANNPELESLKEKIFRLKEEIEKSIAFEPEKAYESFIEMQKHYSDFELKQKQISEHDSEKNNKTILEIESITKQCFELINKLEVELVFDEKEFIQLRFIPPITKSRLEKIRLILTSQEFTSREEQLLKTKELFGELRNAYDSIKLQAIKKYNQGIDSGLSAGVLSKAKSFIDSNNYVQAMFALQGKEELQFNLLLGLIPILVIVIVGLALRQRFNKTEKKEDLIKQKILEEWE